MRELQDWFRFTLLEPPPYPYDDDKRRLAEGYYQNKNAELIYKESANSQVIWVRDNLMAAISKKLWADILGHESYPKFYVIGEHKSKSCVLPVYYIDLGKAKVVFRDNFHDWNISVRSEVPIAGECLKRAIWNTDYCFYQGFPDDWKYGEYSENNKEFSFWLRTREQLYVFFWLLSSRLEKQN